MRSGIDGAKLTGLFLEKYASAHAHVHMWVWPTVSLNGYIFGLVAARAERKVRG